MRSNACGTLSSKPTARTSTCEGSSLDGEPASAIPEPTLHRSQQRRDLQAYANLRAQPLITPGVGKTHLASALAVAACQAGYSVYFTSLDDMVRKLKIAEATGRFNRQLTSYLRPAVLVVDEVGYLPLDRAEANMVFQLVSRRYERGSMIITSNKSFAEWGQVLGDDVLATAILDRLLHHCDVLAINGPSYRLKDRLALVPGGDPMP